MSGRRAYQPIVDVPPQYSSAEAQLQFQSFIQPDASPPQGSISSQPQRIQQAPAAPQADFSYPAAAAGEFGGSYGRGNPNAGIWSLDYYKQYFDVDTDQVMKRVMASFVPSDMFLQQISSNLELYGPFWVPTTVIFSLFVTTSVAGSIVAYLSGKTFDYDFSLLSFAITICYCYTFLAPLCIWAVCKYLGSDAKLLELVSVYGYGMSVWIPVSFLSIIPLELFRWLLVLAACGITTLFALRNTYPLAVRTGDAKAAAPVMGMVILSNVALAAVFKFWFFGA
ncbi:Yip1-domain-containing protein [Gonapodya prolifera JEL478]|uniref:Protein YIP n=1 Tax=Gonapodya prolifera (strain JEL478) TaxID=1344416 RepID=A0A139AK53_GONPJ|nr:Yip1-domain-containing protein [Gonapodya prolifera JEL478]|eukprot:KXS17162.1 Yip1-domain-containing protein [Gonapodya prolifera JEL478]